MSSPHLRQASSSAQIREPRSFGRRREPTVIAFTRNGRTSLFTVKPILSAIGIGVICMFAVGYFGATAYLMLRDDLIGMSQARSARMLHEYEDRIAMLRSNLDRVTSRQLLDQKAIEARVADLMQRQDMLGARSGRVGELIDRAGQFGLEPAQKVDGPTDRLTTGSLAPRQDNSLLAGFDLRGGSSLLFATASALGLPVAVAKAPDIADYGQTQNLFQNVLAGIELVDASQRALLDGLRKQAGERTGRIANVLETLALGDETLSGQAVGGPYLAIDPATAFEAHVDALDASLKNLAKAEKSLSKIPVANPARGAALSSPFGARIDPFLGHAAMHSGADFKAAPGTPVHASASGKVIDAGRNGGYGNMVEIDHGNGITTRYAHLSRITVTTGDQIARGTKVGEIGSTGRSTGPHLHFEIRRNGEAVNPLSFLKAGRTISNLL